MTHNGLLRQRSAILNKNDSAKQCTGRNNTYKSCIFLNRNVFPTTPKGLRSTRHIEHLTQST